jgi:hypothetical protein
MYVVVAHRTLAVIQVYKSIDYGDTWTLLDDVHSKPHSAGTDSYDAGTPISGSFTDYIYVARRTATNTIRVTRFNMATDLWESTDIGGANATTTAHNAYNIRVSVRSDGDVLLVYRNSTDNDLYWTRYEGVSWSAPATLNTSNTSILLDVIMTGNSDMAHVVFYEETANDVTHVSISNANVLGTVTDIDATASIIYNSFGSYVLDGATHRIGFPIKDSTNEYDFVHATSATNPTFTTVASLTPTTVSNPGEQGGATTPYNNKWYVVWSTASGAIYWDASDDFATPAFGTDTLKLTAANANPTVFARTHARGVPIVYTDGFSVISEWLVGPTTRIKPLGPQILSAASDGNRVRNPSMEANIGQPLSAFGSLGSGGDTWVISYDTTQANSGLQSLNINATASTQPIGSSYATSGPRIYGSFSGVLLTFEGYVRKENTSRRGTLLVTFYNASNTSLGTVFLLDTGAITGSWIRLFTTSTAPVGSAYFIVTYQNECRVANGTGNVWFDDVYIGVPSKASAQKVTPSVKTSGTVSFSGTATVTASTRRIQRIGSVANDGIATATAIGTRVTVGGGYSDITFVGAGTPYTYTTGTSISPTVPTGIATGDLLIAAFSFRDQPTTMTTDASGWTALGGDNPFSASTDSKIFAYYRVSDGTEGGTTPTWVASASGAGVAAIVAYRGVNTTTPIDVNPIGVASTTSSQTAQVIPSITTNTDKACVVVILGADDEATSANMFAFPAPFTERVDAEGGANVFLGVGDAIASTAGTWASPGTVTTSTGDFYALQVFALKPAGSAGSGTVKTSGAVALDGIATATSAARRIKRIPQGVLGASLVNSTQFIQTTADTSHTLTGLSTGAGNTLILFGSPRIGSSENISSITDSAGNTWTMGYAGFIPGSNSRIAVWYALNAASVSTITITLSGATGRVATFDVMEWKNVLSVGQPDTGVGVIDNVAGTTTPTAGAFTTTNADDVLVAGIAFAQAATVTAVSSGWTIDKQTPAAGTTTQGQATAYRVVSSAGTYECIFTTDIGVNAGGASLALKAETPSAGGFFVSAVGTATAQAQKVTITVKTSGAVAVSGDSNQTAVARRIQRRTSAFDGVSNTTAQSRRIQRRTSALDAASNTTAVSHAIRKAVSVPTAEGILSATGHHLERGQSALDANGTLIALGRTIRRRTVVATGDSSAVVVVRRIQRRTSTLDGVSSQGAQAQKIQRRITTLDATATQSGIAHAVRKNASALSAQGVVGATATRIAFNAKNGMAALDSSSSASSAARRIQRRVITLDASASTTITCVRIQKRTTTNDATSSATVTSHAIRKALSTLTASANATVVGREIERGQSLLDANGTLTSIGRRIQRRITTISGDSTATSSARRIQRRIVALSGDSNATAVAASTVFTVKNGAATASAEGASTVLARIARNRSSTLSAASSMSAATKAIRRRSAALSATSATQFIGHTIRSVENFTLDADSEVLSVVVAIRHALAILDSTSTLDVEAMRLTTQQISLDANGTLFGIGRRITRGSSALSADSAVSAHSSHIATIHVDFEGNSEVMVGMQYIQYRGAALVGNSNIVTTINPLMNEPPIGGLLRVQGIDNTAISRTSTEDGLAVLKIGDESSVIVGSRVDNEIGLRAIEMHGSDVPPFLAGRVYDSVNIVVGHKTIPTLPIALIHTFQEL